MNLIIYFRKMDKVLFGAAVLLALIGILELVGMAQNGRLDSFQQYKQIVSLAIGILAMFGAMLVDYRFFKNNSYAVILSYAACLTLLVLLLLIGEKTKGSTAWFKIAGFAFAPVELAKIALIALLAKYFSSRHIEMYRFFHLVVSLAYTAAAGALVLLQPDLGSAVILFSIWLLIVLFAGIPKKYLLLLFLIGALIAGGAWFYGLKEYQKNRIINFLNPYADPQGSGYNAIQAMISVGSGGLFGRGLGYGSQVQLGFLPEAHTDFMFASAAEELGFVGIILILSLLGIMGWRIVKIALEAENNFARIFCAGFMALIFVQVAVNAGMNLGLMPITGITFPFLSYGGSSLISLFLGIGLVESIKVRTLR